MDFFQQLCQERILPIIRAANEEEGLALGQRVQAAGWGLVEVSWTMPGAASIVRQLARTRDGVGGGTIVSAAMAEAAITAGCQYLVAPNFSREVWQVAKNRQIPYLPGVMTPSEVGAALNAGLTYLKLFPASVGGVTHLKALGTVFPQAKFVPTGGIVFNDLVRWLNAGAVAVGIGSGIVRIADRESRNMLPGLDRLQGDE